ncbi:3-isopropylmalate dehydratase small subunit 1 [Planctomycetes bacterium Poly30]|uniref:3-isopropylmalate dehydratase n=1 Tax=Saltatorellus ferox TaxID=2528018 RepID=A0A518EXF3_9BACT|nr:3-isopropylmalate dehydratase small subunit 1 [Planctomycetes bacterium Poly30]
MTPAPFERVRSRYVTLADANIDTDQIIPARFLTTTERSGLGAHAFADWRGRPDSPLNDARAIGAEVLVAGDNFGCGSSREHAPWALVDLGFRAVVSTSFADIFRQNAHKNGLLTVTVNEAFHGALLDQPWGEIQIDLCGRTIMGPGEISATFAIDDFAADCLVHGTDELGYLLSFEDAITRFEEECPA